MHTCVRISGAGLPEGGLVFGTDTDVAPDRFVRDLRRAYPAAVLCVVRGLDVVADAPRSP